MAKKVAKVAVANYEGDEEVKQSRAAKNREEKAEKRAEAAARKIEARRLAEQESMELERTAARKSKVTKADLLRRKEEEQAAMQRRVEEEKRRHSRVADQKDYLRMVEFVNTNHDDSIIEARSVEEAIAKMVVVVGGGGWPEDKKRVKASFKVFEEAEMERLKEEKPGLTLGQYKNMVSKLWKKGDAHCRGVLMV